ncbi:SIS domain-containing protein [Salinibacterium sp. SYSU T00001]|uniref:D-sedoheptulose-7-phosphate isomerase n=1 Tax=Homoserinimonas sedimenticola TaxID=2986805 RepID=UPI0022363B02|nr:SIS domain-containing protein [Salinibacterium sedimenticola]MCW4385596.1 SIS domain-containing protein [Salinibacterium sedimenticola]
MTTEWLAPSVSAPARARESDYEVIETHIDALRPVLDALHLHAPQLARWGTELAHRLHGGARAFAAGNGGSAAEAQHLTAEIVGRFDGERRAFSAIALHADTSSVTAIGNDYGYDEVFARQIEAHARPGDVLVLLSTSGKSPNLLKAARAARAARVTTWALTGAGPNPLTLECDDHIALQGPSANVQEAQLVAVHSLCRAFDRQIAVLDGRA